MLVALQQMMLLGAVLGKGVDAVHGEHLETIL